MKNLTFNQCCVHLESCPLAKAGHWGKPEKAGRDLFEMRVRRPTVAYGCYRKTVSGTDIHGSELIVFILQWAQEGAGLNTIAVRLNEQGVLPPSHYKKMQGTITHKNLLGNGK